MRKKALHKDIRQEIKRTFPRFLSLFLMSALGVSFFSGVRASMPDMLSTTDRYLDGTDLFDLQAVSTMGLQEEDLEAVLDTEGVEEAELSYSSDLLCDSEGEQYVVHLMAKSGMAQCQVEEGRMPEKADDIFLDTRLAQSLGCEIGDKITLYEEDQEGDTPEGLAAFGDGDNDWEMLSYARVGVAMENASLECKKAADWIAPSNEEDGVAWGIEKLLEENRSEL